MTDYKKTFESFQKDFGKLIQAGFIAVQQLDERGAKKLFNAAKLLRPKSTAPDLGYGYIHLNKMESEKARKIFECIVAKEPENHLAQVLYGISMLPNKNMQKKGESLIDITMEKTTDKTIINLSKIALEWSKKELNNESASL